jgi:hypothetical protein
MRKLVLGVLIGFLTAATAALALDVSFPTRSKAQARVIVNEVGALLFGAIPGKVEVTNFPSTSSGGAEVVVKDANGAVVGTASPIRPIGGEGGRVFVVRNVGGTQVELQVSGRGVIGGDASFQYDQPNCAGQAYFGEQLQNGAKPTDLRFYPPVSGDGSLPASTIYFPDMSAPAIPVLIQSSGWLVPDASACGSANTVFIAPHTCCVTASFPATRLVFPVASLDVSGFVPPLTISLQ